MGLITKLLGGISVGLVPYVLGGALLALAAQWGYFEWQLREVKRDTWNAATLAQAKADAEQIGTQKTLATSARSEANACWDAVGQQSQAKTKIEDAKRKVQGTVEANLRKEAETQRIEAARAKARALSAQVDADHWQQIAQSKPAVDQTREQACAQVESIITDRVNKRRAAP